LIHSASVSVSSSSYSFYSFYRSKKSPFILSSDQTEEVLAQICKWWSYQVTMWHKGS